MVPSTPTCITVISPVATACNLTPKNVNRSCRSATSASLRLSRSRASMTIASNRRASASTCSCWNSVRNRLAPLCAYPRRPRRRPSHGPGHSAGTPRSDPRSRPHAGYRSCTGRRWRRGSSSSLRTLPNSALSWLKHLIDLALSPRDVGPRSPLGRGHAPSSRAPGCSASWWSGGRRGRVPISSGAQSTSSVTAQSRNRWGHTCLPNACFGARSSICCRIAALRMGRPWRLSHR